MGTMLSYIFIETSIKKNILNKLLLNNIEKTFNSITVDGDMSTSDTVMLFAVPKNNSPNLISKDNLKLFSNGLNRVMTKLAKLIVCDGEGISKLIEINVNNAFNDVQAKKIAFSIGESSLVKTAVAGEDANWGRIIMAIGKTFSKVDLNKISLSFGKQTIIKNGLVSKKINEKKLKNYMKGKIITINLNLKLGSSSKKVWASDLTKKYIEINADYRT